MAAPYLPSVRPFEKGDDFTAWLKALEYYCQAVGAVEPQRKKGMLLHLLGQEVQEAYETLRRSTVETPEQDVYQVAVERLTCYLKPKPNQVFEEVQFQTLNRKPGEKVNTFVARLRAQVNKCSFQDKDIHVRKRLVAGCGYPRLQEKLLGIPDLTLEKAINIAVLHEKAHEEVERLGLPQERKQETIQHVSKAKEKKSWSSSEKKSQSSNEPDSCYRCGRTNHTVDNCFYKTRECYQCGKKGHTKAVCRNTSKKYKKRRKEDEQTG